MKDKLAEAEEAGREKIRNRLEQAELKKEVEELRATVAKIPDEILQAYADHNHPTNGILKDNKGKNQGIGG